MPTFTQFCNFERAISKISVSQIAAQAFEAGDFLYIFFKVLGLLRLALFKKISLTKKKNCVILSRDTPLLHPCSKKAFHQHQVRHK